jgi:hypothetical protein
MPKRSIFYALLCSMLLASASRGEEKALDPPVKAPTSMDALDNVTKLKPGWCISLRIIEDKREELQQTIAATREVQVPYLGLTKAAGMTCRELAFQIKADLEKTFLKWPRFWYPANLGLVNPNCSCVLTTLPMFLPFS